MHGTGNRRRAWLRAGVTLTVSLAIAGAGGCRRKPAEERFKYDLGALRQTDPALVTHREARQLPVPIEDACGLALDGADRIYVCGYDAVAVLATNGEAPRILTLVEPARCLAVDDDGSLYLGGGDRLTVLAADGRRRGGWALVNTQALITAVALADDAVYVADAGNQTVLKYDRTGRLLATLGARAGGRVGQGFVVPSPCFDVAVARDESLWAVNPGRHRLENYGPAGTLNATWGQAGMAIEGFCGCCNPAHIALLPDGGFATSEKGLARIKTYSPQGQFRGVVATTEALGEGNAGLDLAADTAGRILALDTRANVVRIYEAVTPGR